MPILRTYGCGECGHILEVTLSADQWNAEPPECPVCIEGEERLTRRQQMQQEFKPPAIGGSVRSRAIRLAEDIAEKDYNVADFKSDGREGGRPKVRYKDGDITAPSSWAAPNANLAQALALGRESRLKYGSGLDVLHSALKDGSQPDLIELSKRRSIKVW